MSAIRVAPHEYRDPMTHQPFTPEPPRAHEVYPITRRKATPAELARFEDPVREEPRVSPIRIPQGPPKASESIGLVPRHREAFRSDLAVIDALRASHGNISAAGDRLGMSCSGVWRRVDRMRRSGSLPADLVTGRAVQYAARRPRGFRR